MNTDLHQVAPMPNQDLSTGTLRTTIIISTAEWTCKFQGTGAVSIASRVWGRQRKTAFGEAMAMSDY
jgi:hypothetical protein